MCVYTYLCVCVYAYVKVNVSLSLVAQIVKNLPEMQET